MATLVANSFLTRLTNVLFGAGLTDMETCYKLLRSTWPARSTTYIGPNAALYASRMIETQTPFMMLALAAPFVAARRDLAILALVLSAIAAASYLPYRVFSDWWALRFLLPSSRSSALPRPRPSMASQIISSLVSRLSSQLLPRCSSSGQNYGWRDIAVSSM